MKLEGFLFQLNKIEKALLVGFLLVFSGRVCIYGFYTSENMYYLLMSVLGILTLMTIGTIKPVPRMFLIYICMWLSTLLNYYCLNPIFKSPQRNIAFFLVLLVLGPFFTSRRLDNFRMAFFSIVNCLFVLITLVSFVGKFTFLGGRYVAGYYAGCTHHSMMLGCIAGYSTLVCLDTFFEAENKRVRIAMIIATFASAFAALYASSRTVVLSLVAAVLYYILKTFRGNIGRRVGHIMFFVIVVVAFLPIWDDATRGLRGKIAYSGEMGSVLYSREGQWSQRLEEFLHSPIFGVGTHTTGCYTPISRDGAAWEYFDYTYYSMSGSIEPGNAWLFFLSSMGVIGFLAVMYLLVPVSLHLVQASQCHTDGLLVSTMLIYSYVYMMAEAHVTSSGDYNCLYFWLLVAIAGIKDLSQPGRRIGFASAVGVFSPKYAQYFR